MHTERFITQAYALGADEGGVDSISAECSVCRQKSVLVLDCCVGKEKIVQILLNSAARLSVASFAAITFKVMLFGARQDYMTNATRLDSSHQLLLSSSVFMMVVLSDGVVFTLIFMRMLNTGTGITRQI